MTELRALYAEIPVLRGIIEAGLARGPKTVSTACHALHYGDFTILAGEPDASYLRAQADGLRAEIYAPGPWEAALKEVGVPFYLEMRTAFDHAVQPLDGHLRAILQNAPADAAFVPIAGDLVSWCRQQAWAADFVSQFTDSAFEAEGLGVLLRLGGEYVAGASSYAAYPGGIEMQVQTRDDQQGRGYATLAAAACILVAHERGLIATWDAANAASAHIAEKLGYRSLGLYRTCVRNTQ